MNIDTPNALGASPWVAWRKAAATLATETDDLTAFAAFADLEDAFEPIEQQVMKLALDVDIEIQHQIDIARGK